jgi:hypothetical protein
LIKITGASAFGLHASSVARGAPKPHSAPRISVSQSPTFVDDREQFLFTAAPPSGDAGEPGLSGPRRAERALNALTVILVENTGLEPVTSWLQTRRSPS